MALHTTKLRPPEKLNFIKLLGTSQVTQFGLVIF